MAGDRHCWVPINGKSLERPRLGWDAAIPARLGRGAAGKEPWRPLDMPFGERSARL